MQRQTREITYDDGYEDEQDIPLHHKRPFGAGLQRKKVEFVPAQDPDGGVVTTVAATKSTSTAIGDLYASIVMREGPPEATAKDGPDSTPVETCPICSLPATASSPKPHEVSLAHQVCLAHSHPPSHLDRSRMGLRALKAQGWDPDARRGLGRDGEGIVYPIKVAAKEDTLGVGAKASSRERVEKPKKLNAKEMKKLAEREKKRNERLHREVFGSVDVEKYLRGDG